MTAAQEAESGAGRLSSPMSRGALRHPIIVVPHARGSRDAEAERVIARRSRWLIRGLAAAFAYDLASHFHAVRLLGDLPQPVAGPLVVLTNHVSWWDAELYLWLSTTCFPERRGFAPMTEVDLRHYPVLTRVGAFPTWPGGFSGASAFLNTSERLLRERDALLLIASEGRYRDVRCRPLHVMPGVAHLARRVPEATFVPLAIEYAFWRERRPNLLLHFGAPFTASALPQARTPEVTARFNFALTEAMTTLAAAAEQRQPVLFEMLLQGSEGPAAFHPWRRLQAAFGGAARRRPVAV